MMADHWKSIANLLGAPGVDEPEAETQAEETPRSQVPNVQHAARKSPSASSSKTAKPTGARPETSGKKDVSADKKVTAGPPKDAVADDLAEPVQRDVAADLSSQSPASEWHFAPDEPIPDEALSFKSIHSKPARSKTPPQPEPAPTPPPAALSFSEPSPPQPAQARREAPRMPDRTEPSTPAVAPPSDAPPRRKSSWESLANMFNIKVDRPKPAEVAQEAVAPAPEPVQPRGSRPADDADSDADQPFPIFSEDRPARSNPALDAMFGEAPLPSKSSRDNWGKPRVIDDLGWDDDGKDKSSSPRDESSRDGSSHADDASGSASPHGSGDDEAPRRGRRRRRGRRGRSDSADSSASTEAPRSWGGLDEKSEDETDHGLHDDPWDEPESFELVQPDDLDDEPEFDSGDGPEQLAADGEVLRRSSRRRRRGRGSSDRDSETAGTAPSSRGPGRGRTPSRPSSDESDGPVSFQADSEGDDHDEVTDQLESPRAAKRPRGGEGDDSDDRGSRPPRRRRNGNAEKGSGPRRATEGPSRPAATRRPGRPFDDEGPIEDSFDDASLGPDGDEGEAPSGDGQRRAIPTWADSIASLIQANTENRKRGDNRGAPRGRPRGRR